MTSWAAADPTPAPADLVYTPKTFPPCKLFKTNTGTEICGYDNIEDYKKVLVVDIDLADALDKLKNERDRSTLLLQQKDLLQKQVDAYADSQKVLQAHESKLTDDLIALDKKYQDERAKTQWGSPLAWGIAAVSTAVLAGFIIHDAL